MTEDEAGVVLQIAKRVSGLIARKWRCPWERSELEGAAVVEAVYALNRRPEVTDLTAYVYRVCERAATKAVIRTRRHVMGCSQPSDDELVAVRLLADIETTVRSAQPVVWEMVALRLKGLSQRDVARRLGVSQSLVQRRLARLRQSI